MFDKRKQLVLAGLENDDPSPAIKQDRSLKQEIDYHLVETCQLINIKKDFYTTSCCSGRITVFADGNVSTNDSSPASGSVPVSGSVPSKSRGFLVYVDHGDENKTDLKVIAQTIMDKIDKHDQHYDRTREKMEKKLGISNLESIESAWLRFEPLLIHVKARSMGSALSLLKVCRVAGLKEIGITGGDDNTGYDIRIGGSIRMSVPLVLQGKWQITQEQLETFLSVGSEMLTKNCSRIAALNDAIRTLLS